MSKQVPELIVKITLISRCTIFISWQYLTASIMIFMYYLWSMIKIPDLILCEFGLLSNLGIKLATLHVFQDKNNCVLLLEYLVDVDYAWMIKPNEDINFVLSP